MNLQEIKVCRRSQISKTSVLQDFTYMASKKGQNYNL